MGPPILFTSFMLAIGFLIFGLWDMRSMISMAILSRAGILAAVAADLLITPTLFVFLKSFGRQSET